MCNFEYSETLPWFIFNEETFGFDADKMLQDFQTKDKIIIRNTNSEKILDAMQALIAKIIEESFQYTDETVRQHAKRLQLILNGNILEAYLAQAEVFKLTRNSDAKWLFNGTYEIGPDFTSQRGKGVEAKVYYSEESMLAKINEANNGNSHVFHDADFVCCYLITTTKYANNRPYRYQWLRRVNGTYEVYHDFSLDELTRGHMPEKLPLCRCIENTSGEWEITSFYR
jgi:hypothetical protein